METEKRIRIVSIKEGEEDEGAVDLNTVNKQDKKEQKGVLEVRMVEFCII